MKGMYKHKVYREKILPILEVSPKKQTMETESTSIMNCWADTQQVLQKQNKDLRAQTFQW